MPESQSSERKLNPHLGVKEIVEKLEGLVTEEKLDDHFCKAIFDNYDAVNERYPFGKYSSLGNMLRAHQMNIKPSYIETFKHLQTYCKLKPFIHTSEHEEAEIIYDAMFRKEGWAEQYGEYLTEMAEELWGRRPRHAIRLGEIDVEATKHDCQLKFWKWAFTHRNYYRDFKTGVFKDVRNPVMQEFLYEQFVSDGFGTSKFYYHLEMVGVLRHRSKPMAVFTSNTPRKLFEELVHGRYDYFEQILSDFNIYTENWRFCAKDGLLVLLQHALKTPNHPLKSIILKHFKKSRESATLLTELILKRGVGCGSYMPFFSRTVVKCVDAIALCKKGLGIMKILKYNSWRVFKEILKTVKIELIAKAFAEVSYDYYEYRDDPFEYLGLERAYILLRLGALIDIRMRSLEINQQHQNLDTVMKCISADKLPHFATILEVIVNQKVPKIALPSVIRMGDKMVRQVDELPASIKCNDKTDGKTGIKMIKTISEYSYSNDKRVHDYVHWELWNMAKSGQLKSHDLRTLPFKLVDEVNPPLPNYGLRKPAHNPVKSDCPLDYIHATVELETP